MKTAAGMVAGWALMLLCAYALTVVSLPDTGGSFMAYVVGVYYVLPGAFGVLLVGLLTVAVLGRRLRSDLWLGVTAAWTGTAAVLAGAWLL
ncbi:hypothetical protein [Catellatospora vulcania]|uniref:hypothetical protein n=1 Tax=Catellatospora vulcania TaxID=1460450 RepID=UPI0012D3D3A2|nr:hypothetical protein [Catellatospora vulcania]